MYTTELVCCSKYTSIYAIEFVCCTEHTRPSTKLNMVYKTDKFNVHSGNTLRTCNTRDSHLYKRQSYLVRQSAAGLNPAVLDDLGIDKDNVVYSLNKKGRWLVPQILKHELNNSDENIKVDLVESHKLKRKVKYTGFCSNDGFPRKVSPKRTYFDASSLKGKTSDPTVTVNIVTPCPATSSLSRNPKYLDYTPTHQGNDDTSEESQKESNPLKNRKRTHRTVMFMNLEMDDCQEESEHSEGEDGNEEDDIDWDEDAYKTRPTTVCVGDILSHSNDMQKVLFRGLNTYQSKDAVKKTYNQHALTEQGMENGATENPSTTSPSVTNSMEKHVTVFIPNTEVLTGHLQEVFGEKYVECRCFPRKFIIDITEKVTSTILKSKAFQNRDMKRVDLSAVLVFTYDMFGSLDCTDMDAFKVSINMKTTQLCLKLDTLPENGVFGIEEIVQGAISYITSIPCDQFVSKDIPSHKTKSARTNHNILKLCTTDVTTISPENITIKDMLKENRKKHNTLGNVNFESLPPDSCSICFESILDSPATALQTCGHWFCDRCWNDHVISTASCRSRSVTCPEYKCQSTVNNDILLTISNIQTVEKLFRREIEKEMDKECSSKWCPNKKCGRVLRYEIKEIGQIMNVTCECGTMFCFDCLQRVHWPLSCRDHDRYLKKLKEQGHMDKDTKTVEVVTYAVRGKNCPVCKTFVEKEGGCFWVSCICGTTFCWGCLTTDSLYHQCYYGDMYSTSGDNFGTIKRNIFHSINNSPSDDQPDWYKRAVMIRSWRNPSTMKTMRSAVRAMCRTLTSYKRRKDTGIGAELENFELPASQQYTCVVDKIPPFLISMIDIYLEASLICEYTTVFLEMCQDHNIIQIRDGLQRLTKDIYKNFRDSNNADLKSSITRLFHLRIECEKAINKLVDIME